jgi:6 kDa early secretory antigenic target
MSLPDGGGIRVNHTQLDQISDDLAATVKQMDARLDEMENNILKLAGAGWSGVSRDAFDVSRQKWNNALAEMAALLNKTGAQVSISNGEYAAADKRGANALTIG